LSDWTCPRWSFWRGGVGSRGGRRASSRPENAPPAPLVPAAPCSFRPPACAKLPARLAFPASGVWNGRRAARCWSPSTCSRFPALLPGWSPAPNQRAPRRAMAGLSQWACPRPPEARRPDFGVPPEGFGDVSRAVFPRHRLSPPSPSWGAPPFGYSPASLLSSWILGRHRRPRGDGISVLIRPRSCCQPRTGDVIRGLAAASSHQSAQVGAAVGRGPSCRGGRPFD